MNQPVIHARDLRVSLDGRPILHDIDLDVQAGEFLAVLGPNGSGKSTLIRSIVGLIGHEGRIELFGTPLHDFTERHRIGYLPQHPDQAAGVPSTVTEVVLSGTLARHRWWGWPTRAERAEVTALITRVGLSDQAHRPVNDLSGGQRQRTHIARALVGGPDLLIMDEPTVGVDVASLEVFAELLADVVAEGTAVVMVAHELGPLRPLVDRAIKLAHGTIIYDGPPDNLSDLIEEHHPHTSEPSTIAPVVVEGPFS